MGEKISLRRVTREWHVEGKLLRNINASSGYFGESETKNT